ncbi:EthD domain-containing protein [Pseudomaricurvus sp. HS19]|uniref:EthD domain-containing protein n=1 Tax=Pseudomaricurvus sp. HS19 TaxID=2692626 RepID=UPI00136C51F7|nr:EthD domain-containing protein [Pseudomaricurvus sp. HS19]MYM64747.1 EthD family reductase [Pseudomaricurvus sp. HS19]
MLKILCFFKRRPGMTRAEFRAYYEANHAPLIEKMIPFYISYKRNFVEDVQDYKPAHITNNTDDSDEFDVMTELTFSSRDMLDKMMHTLSNPEVGDVIAADEANLFDRDSVTILIVDEVSSPELAHNA